MPSRVKEAAVVDEGGQRQEVATGRENKRKKMRNEQRDLGTDEGDEWFNRGVVRGEFLGQCFLLDGPVRAENERETCF